MKETGSIALRLGLSKTWNVPTPPVFYTPVYINQTYLLLLNDGMRETLHLILINSKMFYTYNCFIFHTQSHLIIYNKRVRDRWQFTLANPKFTKRLFKYMPPVTSKFLTKRTFILTQRHSLKRLLVPYRHLLEVPLTREVGLIWLRKQERNGRVTYIENKENTVAYHFDSFRRLIHKYKRKSKREIPNIKPQWPYSIKLALTDATKQLIYNKNHGHNILKRLCTNINHCDITNPRKTHVKNMRYWEPPTTPHELFFQLLHRQDRLTPFRNLSAFSKPHLIAYEQPLKAALHIQHRNQIYSNIARVSLELFLQDKLTTSVTVFQHSLWNTYLGGKQAYQQTQKLIKTFRIFSGLAGRRIYIYDIILLAYHSLFLRDAHTLAVFMTHELARTKHHRFIIYFFTRQLLNNLVVLQTRQRRTTHGFSCSLYGPIGKHGRTKKLTFVKGRKPRGQLRLLIVSGRSEANTFYGTLGLRLWIS
jgi:hypothetical protein